MENDELIKGRTTYIYGLFEVGKENEIRYVGKTFNPSKRLVNHLYDKNNTYKANWIKSVLKKGSKISYIIIEECNDSNWKNREIFWISEYKKIGHKLTNYSIGGEGSTVYTITYNECKEIMMDKNVNSKNEFVKWLKSDYYDDRIPKSPREVFKEWVSWGDFLGTGKIQDNKLSLVYLSYEECKKWIVDNLDTENITSIIYKKMARNGEIPDFIPNRPNRFYEKRGWISWSDFLSNDKIIQNQKKVFVSYEECKKFANDNNIKSLTSWWKIEKPLNIPSTPYSIYNEWVSWSDFLGVEIISDNEKAKLYMSYEDAKKYLYENLPHIYSKPQFKRYILDNNIKNIPLNPDNSYKGKGWVNWDSFFSRDYLPYDEAKKIVKDLNIKTNKEWRIFNKTKDKKYKNIPNCPDKIYKNDWIDWFDWLGKEKKVS